MTNTPRLLDAKPLDGFVVYVRFEDGLEAEVDLGYLSEGKATGVFAPLRDPDYFRKFRVYEHGTTIYWPRRLRVAEGEHDDFMPPGPEAEWADNVQADIAPETLYAHAQAHSKNTSFEADRKRLGTEPATLAEFEAEYGPVQPPDGEG